jgi:hypothetical protein
MTSSDYSLLMPGRQESGALSRCIRAVFRAGGFPGGILMDRLYQTWTAQTCGGPERP